MECSPVNCSGIRTDTGGAIDYACKLFTPSAVIPAQNPERIATILAELMGGKCFPSGPLDGAFMPASDEPGSMIKVYPERATLDIPTLGIESRAARAPAR
jgi:hypothetical protein